MSISNIRITCHWALSANINGIKCEKSADKFETNV